MSDVSAWLVFENLLSIPVVSLLNDTKPPVATCSTSWRVPEDWPATVKLSPKAQPKSSAILFRIRRPASLDKSEPQVAERLKPNQARRSFLLRRSQHKTIRIRRDVSLAQAALRFAIHDTRNNLLLHNRYFCSLVNGG